MKKSCEFSPSSVPGFFLCVTLTQFSADQGRRLEKGSEISRSLQSSLFCSRINVKQVYREGGGGTSEYKDVKREQHFDGHSNVVCVVGHFAYISSSTSRRMSKKQTKNKWPLRSTSQPMPKWVCVSIFQLFVVRLIENLLNREFEALVYSAVGAYFNLSTSVLGTEA